LRLSSLILLSRKRRYSRPTTMSKVIKQMQMDALKTTFRDVRDLVVMNVKGLTCQADCQLRAALRKKKIRLQVVKNSYTRRVFGELGIDIPADSPYWKGTTVFAFGAGSVAELSKGLESELKAPKTAALYKDKVIIKGALADGQIVTFEQALKMPTLQEAIGRVVSLALSPASRLVSALQGPAGGVAGQIKTISEKKEETPAPAA
jgi:large subunit ribosomal protein L10